MRAAFDERERILPLQNVEMLKIRHKIDSFGDEVATFRSEFRNECPFSHESFIDLAIPEDTQAKLDDAANSFEAQRIMDKFEEVGYDKAYALLDEYFVKTGTIQKTAKEYNNLEILFDISVSNYRSLKESLDDLVLLGRDKALPQQFITTSHTTPTTQLYRCRTGLMDMTVFHVW